MRIQRRSYGPDTRVIKARRLRTKPLPSPISLTNLPLDHLRQLAASVDCGGGQAVEWSFRHHIPRNEGRTGLSGWRKNPQKTSSVPRARIGHFRRNRRNPSSLVCCRGCGTPSPNRYHQRLHHQRYLPVPLRYQRREIAIFHPALRYNTMLETMRFNLHRHSKHKWRL